MSVGYRQQPNSSRKDGKRAAGKQVFLQGSSSQPVTKERDLNFIQNPSGVRNINLRVRIFMIE